MHDVGVHSPFESDGRYDTPSLVEIYRTAPYLHDGRAATIKDVLTRFNPDDKHGITQGFTPGELDDLAAYILSL
jgi:cytochrome c peroxidase